MVPLPDGSAYGWGDDWLSQPIWYLVRDKAYRVHLTTYVSHIKPCSDGGAYAFCDDPRDTDDFVAPRDQTGGVWYLKGAKAERITSFIEAPESKK